jgi:hypothetical protein
MSRYAVPLTFALIMTWVVVVFLLVRNATG